jgi:hypothetical protein
MKTKKASMTLYLKETGNSYVDDACERQAFRTDVRTEFIDTTINRYDNFFCCVMTAIYIYIYIYIYIQFNIRDLR